jgi:ubiquinone/menaquinone biosynthesis C-methylase UbiE
MDYKDLQAGQTKENFWFKAKNDLIKTLMSKVCKNKKKLRILNLGVGTGDDLKILNSFGKNYIVDIDKEALSFIDQKLYAQKKIADACNIPYKDNFFDIVVSFDVFEHIEKDYKAIDEVHRVLKKKGALVFTVPAFQFLFSSHDKALQHRRRYNRKELRNIFFQFRNLRTYYWNSLLFFPMALIRLLEKNSRPKVNRTNMPSWLNNVFYKILSVDNFFIKKNFSLPVGLSLAGYCYK